MIQSSKSIIQVLLACGGQSIIHPLKQLVHPQIIPCDIIDLMFRRMSQIQGIQFFKTFGPDRFVVEKEVVVI